MKIDLKGRVNNTRLAPTNCLLPIFEAIVNSMHAIEEAKSKHGKIDITILRDPTQKTLQAEGEPVALAEVIGFRISDNGIGFTEKNYKSFDTSDTTHKATKGGKGVGRLMWLKAFTKAEIESTYSEDGKHWKRRFDFTYSDQGIENPTKEEVSVNGQKTCVALVGFKDGYVTYCPKKASTIAARIIEHCLEYFVLKTCPKIMLHDPDDATSMNLQYVFTNEMNARSNVKRLTLKDQKFTINHVVISLSSDAQHRLNFCAHKRPVKSEALEKKIPNLGFGLKDEKGKQICYAGYVSGSYLDSRVNNERTSFDLFEDFSLRLEDELTWADLEAGIHGEVVDFLGDYIEPIRQSKEDRIRRYVQEKAPQYRPLIKHKQKYLDDIPPGITDDKLEIELYKADQKYDSELKEIARALMSESVPKAEQAEEMNKIFNQFIDEWNEHGMAKLAQYVAHRKATLSFLERRLHRRDDGRYELENTLHKIIFPLKTTSDDVRADQMNLWLIDEKLAYHYYLASDTPFKKIEPLDLDSSSRTDLIIFNKPFAFTDSPYDHSSIVLVEFKRPDRDDFTDEENPINQVYDYIREIKSGKAKDRHGVSFRVPPNTPFYAYIICDLKESLVRQAENATLRLTPDSQGFFGFNEKLGAYVEIISFSKLINDAKKRNAVLFDKLNIGY